MCACCLLIGLLSTELASYSKKSTISSREIQTSVRLILPGELAKHAISEGTKSVTFVLNNFSFVHTLSNVFAHLQEVQCRRQVIVSLIFRIVIVLFTINFLLVLWSMYIHSLSEDSTPFPCVTSCVKALRWVKCLSAELPAISANVRFWTSFDIFHAQHYVINLLATPVIHVRIALKIMIDRWRD